MNEDIFAELADLKRRLQYLETLETNMPFSQDAFGQTRVSTPVSLLSELQLYSENSLVYEDVSSGAGNTVTYDANSGMKLYTLGGTNAGFAGQQSYAYLPYQAGRSQRILLTGNTGAAVTGITKRIGFFDVNDGPFYEVNGTDKRFVVRSSVSGSISDANYMAQSGWSLDTFNGNGPSGINLDLTKVQIVAMDLQFLAMGQVRVGFDIDGRIIWAHEFKHANVLTVPYMRTACLPVRAEIRATGATAGTMYFKCADISSEGGETMVAGYTFGRGGPDATVNSGTNWTHLFGIRPTTTFASRENRVMILPQALTVMSGSNSVEWCATIGASFSVAPTWTAHNSTYSAVEYGTGGTLTTATDPGLQISFDYSTSSGGGGKGEGSHDFGLDYIGKYPISLNAAGAARAFGAIHLFARNLGTNTTARGAMNWREIR